MVRITYTQSSKPTPKHSHLIEDLLEMACAGKQGCVDGVIKMISDLYKNGVNCRYLKGLGGGLLELKIRIPTGGARVYLFQGGEDELRLPQMMLLQLWLLPIKPCEMLNSVGAIGSR